MDGGGSVYNLNNVPLDVDPKCIFVVQIYYRVFFLNESFSSKQKRVVFFVLFFPLFGAWAGAGGAGTSCLKLHEVFTEPSDHQIFISVSAVIFFLSLIVRFSVPKCKGTLASSWTHFLL